MNVVSRVTIVFVLAWGLMAFSAGLIYPTPAVTAQPAAAVDLQGGMPITWTQTAELTASDAMTDSFFGWSVAIDGDIVVVGAPYHDGPQTDRGAVYVYQKPAAGWQNMTQIAQLTASDGLAGDQFGGSVAILGDYIVVGAPDDGEHSPSTGKVYLFEKPAGGWQDMTETAQLTTSDLGQFDRLGLSVAMIEDVIVIGVHLQGENLMGAAYVYEKPAEGWHTMTETAKLTASDQIGSSDFGIDVAIDHNVIVVGANNHNQTGERSGVVYLFERPGMGWKTMTETAKLIGSDTVTEDKFGTAVDISGNTVTVGSIFNNVGGHGSGAAYLFERPEAGWAGIVTETAKLTASDSAAGDWLGSSIALFREDIVVVGASLDGDEGFDSGSVYIYQRPLAGWSDMTETSKIVPLDVELHDVFGISVAINGSTIVVGSNGDEGYTGSAYIFEAEQFPIFGLQAWNSSPVLVGGSVQFTATAEFGSDVTYAWAFGDGQTGTGATPTHSYAITGSYTATVTATNSFGSVTATTQVTVLEVQQQLYLPVISLPAAQRKP